MIKHGLAACAALALAPPVMAQTDNARIAADVRIVSAGQGISPDSLTASSVTIADGVRVRPAVRYATLRGYRPLTLDLYTPPAKSGSPLRRPLLVHIHGGAWAAGDPRHSAAYQDLPAILGHIAAKGYVVASVSYRLSGEAPFPAALQDVKAAVRFLRLHADSYGIDPDRVGIWGDSAGGHLVGLAGTTCGVAAFEPETQAAAPGRMPIDAPSDCVQAVVSWYGIFDLMDEGPVVRPPPPPNDPTRIFLGCTVAACTDAQRRAASPITYVDKTDAPFLLIHGSADRAVPLRQSELFQAALKAVNVPVELLVIPDVGHGWIGKTPEATLGASRQALKATLDYFDGRFRPRR